MGHMALVVDRRGAALEAGTHQTVVVKHADGRRERVGLRALGSVVLHGDVQLSTGLLQSLASHGVALAVLPLRGSTQAVGFTQLPHRQATLRHCQHLAYACPSQRLELARLVVQAKFEGAAAFAAEREPSLPDGYGLALRSALAAPDVATLMGVEGVHAVRHFERLERAYAAGGPFTFSGRSRRPPEDAPNALMSLSYTLAQAQAAQLALHAGLDVQLGFLHGLQRDRQSLALDLLEAARAPIDGWVLQLLARQRLIEPKHFGDSPDGPIRLNQEGRSIFYPLWFSQGHLVAMRPMRRLLARLVNALRSSATTAAHALAGEAQQSERSQSAVEPAKAPEVACLPR